MAWMRASAGGVAIALIEVFSGSSPSDKKPHAPPRRARPQPNPGARTRVQWCGPQSVLCTGRYAVPISTSPWLKTATGNGGVPAGTMIVISSLLVPTAAGAWYWHQLLLPRHAGCGVADGGGCGCAIQPLDNGAGKRLLQRREAVLAACSATCAVFALFGSPLHQGKAVAEGNLLRLQVGQCVTLRAGRTRDHHGVLVVAPVGGAVRAKSPLASCTRSMSSALAAASEQQPRAIAEPARCTGTPGLRCRNSLERGTDFGANIGRCEVQGRHAHAIQTTPAPLRQLPRWH